MSVKHALWSSLLSVVLAMGLLPGLAVASDGKSLAAMTLDLNAGKLAVQSASSDDFVVVLDPGHGGHDAGASGIGFTEKEVNLKIAQYASAELQGYSNVEVYMTRESDVYVGLSDRVDYAMDKGADLVVSIHNNASSTGAGRGSEVIVPRDGSWYRYETHVVGVELGNKILDKLSALGLDRRSVYSRDCTTGQTYPDGTLCDYFSLIDGPRWHGVCGIIVEHAFVDNEHDAAFLRDEANLQALGKADAQAIAEQLGLKKGPTEEDYRGVYDYEYYTSHYSDMAQVYGDDRDQIFHHFIEYGMNEGRRASVLFDQPYYRQTHADVARAYGDDTAGYYLHFLEYGLEEGRQGSSDFSPASYYRAYPDLRRAFEDDWESYYLHYLDYGQAEGRTATGVSDLLEPCTTCDGVDWSAVYDYAFYAEHNSDAADWATRKAEPETVLDDGMLLEHFAEWGAAEGCQASAAFELACYYKSYPDLRAAYGTDWRDYYLHYIDYGQREGRICTGATELLGRTSSAGGMDYSAVYDPYYYIEHAPDVAAWATVEVGSEQVVDDNMMLEHFTNWGMAEGRQASAAFEFDSYYKRYPDLRRAFGADREAYYLHYIEYGQYEGRIATGQTEMVYDAYDDSAIMGPTRTSVDQMVRRYNAVGRPYPGDVYAQYGAGSIWDFCQILYEEATYENVRPEAVFAQAMYETGWLQFGGSVQADQCNFAGIRTGDGSSFNSFNDWGADSVRKGLRAQVQHLKAYASTEAVKLPIVDPRFGLVTRGCAPTVYDLSGRWAPDATYGERVMSLIDALFRA